MVECGALQSLMHEQKMLKVLEYLSHQRVTEETAEAPSLKTDHIAPHLGIN